MFLFLELKRKIRKNKSDRHFFVSTYFIALVWIGKDLYRTSATTKKTCYSRHISVIFGIYSILPRVDKRNGLLLF